MKIILLQDLRKKGKTGEILEVKRGFARNYLFPNNFARLANKKNLSFYEKQKKALNEKNDAMRQKALDVKKQIMNLDHKTINMAVPASKEGKLYSTITSVQISDFLREKYNIVLDDKMISTKNKIKSLGTHMVLITLFPDIDIMIDVQLTAKQGTTT